MEATLQDRTGKRTWKPLTAGILTIVAGIIDLLAGIGVIVMSSSGMFSWYLWAEPWQEPLVRSVLSVMGVVYIIFGIVSIAGGVFALLRKLWGLALTGAICALFLPPITILGILAIIFISLARGEFIRRPQPVQPGASNISET